MILKPIFEYTDYRQYLSDYYLLKKLTQQGFSHRYFLDRAGIKSPSFLKEVIDGKKNLSSVSIPKFAEALELSKRETDYFTCLVLFNQAKTPKKKNHYFTKLSGFLNRSSIHKLRKNQFEYFASWYHIAVREYIHAHDFFDDFETLSAAIEPKITINQAEKAVRLLKKLNLITLGEDGFYKVSDPFLTFDSDIENIAAHNLHKSMQSINALALDNIPKDQRYFRTFIGSFSESTFQKIRMEIDKARMRILDIIQEDTGKKKVYHMGMQLYPLQRGIKKRRGKK